jgi:ketosteroid isomerase-like protein
VTDKVSLLRRSYEGLQRGDFETATVEFADDIRWYMPAAEGLPAAGVFHGKDEVRWMFSQIRSEFGGSMDAQPVEFIDGGATIVVMGNLAGEGNGGSFRVPYATIWRFNAEERPYRAMTFFDTAVVRDALNGGPPPPPPPERPVPG